MSGELVVARRPVELAEAPKPRDLPREKPPEHAPDALADRLKGCRTKEEVRAVVVEQASGIRHDRSQSFTQYAALGIAFPALADASTQATPAPELDSTTVAQHKYAVRRELDQLSNNPNARPGLQLALADPNIDKPNATPEDVKTIVKLEALLTAAKLYREPNAGLAVISTFIRVVKEVSEYRSVDPKHCGIDVVRDAAANLLAIGQYETEEPSTSPFRADRDLKAMVKDLKGVIELIDEATNANRGSLGT